MLCKSGGKLKSVLMNFDSPSVRRERTDEIKRLLSETEHTFESAMEDNMNTALALSIFMRFVNEINIFAAMKS